MRLLLSFGALSTLPHGEDYTVVQLYADVTK